MYSTSKCKVMHLGKRNARQEYTMEGTVLESTVAEKDIGVMIQDSLKPSLHCAKTAAKANGVLGQLSRAVMYRDSITFIRLYIVYVRPILEYCIQAVGPHTAADKLCLEKIQMRAVNMVSNIGKGTYIEKLSRLNLTTLEERRWRGDMIQTWRIMTGKDRVQVSTWFDLEVDRRREGATTTRNSSGHHAIRPRVYEHQDRGHFFSNRVVTDYNSLPDHVKQAKTINSFKNLLDKHRGTPTRINSRPTGNMMTRGQGDQGTS
jgi:ribonuclease P/MRP protein subunit RPP40